MAGAHSKMHTHPLAQLSAFDPAADAVNVIIETPKGHRNKFTYDVERGLFQLGGVLPVGAVFPFDFGFIPATLGGDGDPLDVLVLMEEPAFVGCLVVARLLGVIEAEQTEDGTTTRNDRLIAVPVKSPAYREVGVLAQLGGGVVDEIEHFFISYNQAKGKVFTPRGRFGPAEARRVVEEGVECLRHKDSHGQDAE